MVKEIVFGLIGGLGFLLYGMNLMSGGLRRVAGDKLRSILNKLTTIPLIAVLLGTGLTCLIQSSSSMTVIVVGLVNAGLLTLRQAIGVVMGANIGTTFTAWLISFLAIFKISTYALPAVGIGFLLTIIGKNRKIRYWGEIILGFGILFIGLHFIKDVSSPIGKSEFVRNVVVMGSHYPVLGFLFGMFLTILLQSSSATVAMVQIMAFNGLISFEMAVPIILGENIGTTVTAQMASIGGNLNARRTAMAHTLFNVIGSAYMMVLVYTGTYPKFIEWLVPGPISDNNVMLHIALAHSVFNIFNAFIVFLPAINVLEKLSIWLVPEKEGDQEAMAPRYLEQHLLDSPQLAFNQARTEMIYMTQISQKAVREAVTGFFNKDTKLIKKVKEREEVTDNFQREISRYLIELSRRELDVKESEQLPVLLHSINDIERVGDHAVNIAELTERKVEMKLKFSQKSQVEMKNIYEKIDRMIEKTIEALKNYDVRLAKEVLELEGELNKMRVELRSNHTKRLNKGECLLDSGIVFVDFVDNMEKIGDHLSNIAQSIAAGMRWESEG
ncbi:MAG: Na/Pi cotransporter family protein [Elusimicrobia bacterium]|nr:Na/Pi cotransporter family protein [Elusimicrobiota bacterium]